MLSGVQYLSDLVQRRACPSSVGNWRKLEQVANRHDRQHGNCAEYGNASDGIDSVLFIDTLCTVDGQNGGGAAHGRARGDQPGEIFVDANPRLLSMERY